ncbi:MAG: histidine kinase [Micrococcales bacterium]|nr:histidine kinase [Micrococcales bacterium]MCL2667491.1 histidine kinase [Micrococcales bacterium]
MRLRRSPTVDRAQTTELAVAAERNRIAREMHDIVAHSLSVIVIQADGGRLAAATDPEAAQRALVTIAETGRAALADTRRILGLLRSTDQADRAPVPETSSVDELVATVRAAGLDVAHVQTGSPRHLPPAVGTAVHRIAQESLTNVLKHAGTGVRAVVSEVWHDSGFRLVVTNTPGASTPKGSASPGHGIVGMRERAELFGGTLTAGPADNGGFCVRADLPYPDDDQWESDE